MKNMKNTMVARVPASLKLAALAATLLVPAGAFAQATSEYDFNTAPKSESLLQSVSAKLFYGGAQEKAIKDSEIPRVDIGGLTVEYTRNLTPYIDFVAALSIGGGSSEYERTEYNSDSYDYYKMRGEVTLFTYEAEVGVNLRAPVSGSFSFFVGPRVGVNALYAEVEMEEWTSTAHSDKKESDTDVGFLYGVDVGATISFTEHHGMTFGVGYRASTARPETSGIKIEDQSWVRVSVGYQFTF